MNRRERRAAASEASRFTSPAAPQGFDLALAHHKAGRLDEAERLYISVLSCHPGHGDAFHLLGLLASQTGRAEAGAVLVMKAIGIDPGIAPYHSSHGNAMRLMGRPESAVASFRTAIALDPGLAEAHNNLGLALMDMAAFGDAAECFRAAILIRFDLAEAHNNLGTAFKLQSRLEEAAACFHDALSFRPAYPEAHSNLGTVLSGTGAPREAAASFRRAIALDPGMADAHFNLSTALLSLGEMEEGWREFEWRWKTPQMAPRRRFFAQPQWQGGPGGGRRLLIHAEQGFGDTLQFCRYVPMAAEMGWDVVVEVQPPLVRLLGSLQGASRVIPAGDPLPVFDEHCPMLSLPLCFRTELATVPARMPHLAPGPGDAEAWRRRPAADCLSVSPRAATARAPQPLGTTST